MIISGLHIGSDFGHTAMVQLQDDRVTSVIRMGGGVEDHETLGAALAMSNMVDLTIVDASGSGLGVFNTLRKKLPHKRITGVSFLSGNLTPDRDFIWWAPKASYYRTCGSIWPPAPSLSIVSPPTRPTSNEKYTFLATVLNRPGPTQR